MIGEEKMSLNYIPVTTKEQITELAELAKVVWNECFTSILSQDQIDYMVDKFQSISAMADQIQNQSYQYFFLNQEGENIGYTALKEDDDKLFLSKLYIKEAYRGQGYASETFEFLEGMCLGMDLKAIWLTVNRFNEGSVHIYEKKGFQTVRTQVTDIGAGYVMDDFVMEKTV